MRRPIQATAFVFLAALLAISGCQKVNESKTYTLNPGEVKTLIVDAPTRDQDVTVTVDSSGPVDVYIAAEKDVNDANDKILPPKNPLGSKTAAAKDTVSAKVPAKTAYGVVLLNAKNKDTKVTVNLKAQ